jgi:hypothetical protein
MTVSPGLPVGDILIFFSSSGIEVEGIGYWMLVLIKDYKF